MPKKKLDADLQPMTLATIAGGELESQFQERLLEVLEVLRDHKRLEPETGGKFRCKIMLEIGVEFDPSDSTYTHWARALHPSKPKPVSQERDAYARSDGLKVLPELVQEELPE